MSAGHLKGPVPHMPYERAVEWIAELDNVTGWSLTVDELKNRETVLCVGRIYGVPFARVAYDVVMVRLELLDLYNEAGNTPREFSQADVEEGWDRATISVPTVLLNKSKSKAKGQRRSFSAYISTLIERDLEMETGCVPAEGTEAAR